MAKVGVFLITLALLLSTALGVEALPIAFFDNGTYTDPTQESANLSASLTGLGHTVNVFSGITAADWTAATTGVPLLVIPELDRASLFPDLSAAARTAIASYVSGGGALLMFDRTTSQPRTIEMLNGIFGYSLSPGQIDGSQSLNAAAAAGTAFEGGPATLPDPSATEGVTIASLPGGALNIYDDDLNSSLFVVGFGAGRIGFLGFDWFELPTPSEWENVLGRAITDVTGQARVPAPGALALLGLGLAAGAFLRRRGD